MAKNLRETVRAVSKRLEGLSSVRRVHVRLGRPPHVLVDLTTSATPNDNETVRAAIAELKCDLPVDIVRSGAETITADCR